MTTMHWHQLSAKTKNAINRYGYSVCRDAAIAYERGDGGASTIGFTLGLKTQQADAAIDAGTEILTIERAKALPEVLAALREIESLLCKHGAAGALQAEKIARAAIAAAEGRS